jgi:DNA-binding XRE family transcriptional regulator
MRTTLPSPRLHSRGASARPVAPRRAASAANQKLAKAIRTDPRKNGQTQEKAARRAGIDRSYFGSIERGEFNISLDTIVKIAAGLETKPSALCARARL